MSIINDALKKAQQLRKHDQEKHAGEPAKDMRKPKRRRLSKAQFVFTWKMASLLTVTALLIMMLLSNQKGMLTFKPYKWYSANTVMPVTTTKPVSKVKVTFDGVFMSDDAKVALINKHLVQEGDLINGLPIIRIENDRVALRGSKGIIILKSGETTLI